MLIIIYFVNEEKDSQNKKEKEEEKENSIPRDQYRFNVRYKGYRRFFINYYFSPTSIIN